MYTYCLLLGPRRRNLLSGGGFRSRRFLLGSGLGSSRLYSLLHSLLLSLLRLWLLLDNLLGRSRLRVLHKPHMNTIQE